MQGHLVRSLAFVAIVALALSGCELIVDFDRSKIGDAGGPPDAFRPDSPEEDGGDMDAEPADGGMDAGDVDAGDVDGGEMDAGDVDGGPCSMDVECDDMDPCTTDTCPAGSCVFTPMVCDDMNECTTDACSGGSCMFTNVAAGTGCEDGMFCTVGDMCDASGTCTAGAARTCDDTMACTADACDETADMCRNVSVNDAMLAVGFGTGTAEDQVRLRNPSADVAIDFGGYYLCDSTMCVAIPAGTAAAASGTVVLDIGLAALSTTGGELLVSSAATVSATTLCDYVQWGSGGGANAMTAVTAGQWTAASAFVDVTGLGAGEAIRWDPAASTDNDAPVAWSVSATF